MFYEETVEQEKINLHYIWKVLTQTYCIIFVYTNQKTKNSKNQRFYLELFLKMLSDTIIGILYYSKFIKWYTIN